MRKHALTIFFLTCILIVKAQTPGIISSTRYGGSGDDKLLHVIQLKNGNLVYSGTTNSGDGQAVGNHGGTDFFIVCTSERGQLLWKKVMGGSGDDGVNYAGNDDVLSATNDGGFYFGSSTPSTDGDIPASKGNSDAFVAKFDENGNVIWKKTYGGDQAEFLAGIIATPDNGCIFAGTTGSNENGDVPAIHGSNTDIWIVKLNAVGIIEWSKTFGGTGNEIANCIKTTSDGGYVFTADVASDDGDLTGTVPVGAFRRNDFWIVKLNNAGAIVWNKRIGGSDDDDGAKVLESSTGDLYVLGNSKSADGDFIANAGLYDVALIKLTANGNITYIKTMGGGAWDSGSDLVEAKDGNIILTGVTYSASIDGIGIRENDLFLSDCFVLKADKDNGNIKWVSSFGGHGGDFARSLIQSLSGETIVVGETNSVDLDFPGGLGGFDAFVLKIAPYNLINGNVYYDYNGNGVRDGSEPLVENINVTTTKNNNYSISGYTENGYYQNDVDSGSFVTKPRILNHDYYTVFPDSVINSFSGYYGTATLNFGLKPIAGKKDVRTIIIPLNAARPGFTSYYKLICYNVGTDSIEDGTINFYKDPKTSFVSSFPIQNSISGDTITWIYKNFRPLDTLVYDIALTLAGPPALHNGNTVVYKSVIEPVTTDLAPGDNTFLFYHLLTGSFDPNEKEESHAGVYSKTALAKKDFIVYSIRFQNTGNDTAFNIVIKDTLDSQLDLTTFEPLSGSHKAALNISGNICTWTFSNILLADFTRNEPASHGYISFRIRPRDGVELNDQIYNNASIYFDYNEPVKTNTVVTDIKDTTLADERLVLAKPVTSVIAYAYCSNQSLQKFHVLNIPGPEYQATVSPKLDNINLILQADSSVTVDPSQLNVGSHQFSVFYYSKTDTTSVTKSFNISQSVTPQVKLSANHLQVSNGQEPVLLKATNVSGGGTSPLYALAKDSHFSILVQPENVNNEWTIQPPAFSEGDNVFYVRMKTSESCYTAPSAIDSIIIKNQINIFVDSGISISPNPFSNELTIKGLDPTQTMTIQIYDPLGRMVLTKVTTGQQIINLHENLVSGNFYLVIYNNKNQMVGSVKLIRRL